jgi:hypothetical protein
MKTINWLSLVVLAALAVGCDPYTSAQGGTPNIVAVTGADFIDGATAIEATEASGVWTFGGTAALTCGDTTIGNTAGFFDQKEIFITFDRQVSGALVQTSPTDCTPAAGWLTVTPAAPNGAGFVWYSCYSPSSPKASEGGSVVVYLAADTGSSGWANAEFVAGTVGLHITGTVAGRAIDVVTNTCP